MSFIEMTRSFIMNIFIPMQLQLLFFAYCCGKNCGMRTHFLVAGLKKYHSNLQTKEVWHQKFLVKAITHPATLNKLSKTTNVNA